MQYPKVWERNFLFKPLGLWCFVAVAQANQCIRNDHLSHTGFTILEHSLSTHTDSFIWHMRAHSCYLCRQQLTYVVTQDVITMVFSIPSFPPVSLLQTTLAVTVASDQNLTTSNDLLGHQHDPRLPLAAQWWKTPPNDVLAAALPLGNLFSIQHSMMVSKLRAGHATCDGYSCLSTRLHLALTQIQMAGHTWEGCFLS